MTVARAGAAGLLWLSCVPLACLGGITPVAAAETPTEAPAEAPAEAPVGASQVVVETLLQTTESWDRRRYRRYPAGQPQLSLLRYRIPPHTALPWHAHPVPNVAYVVKGVLTVERRADGATLTLGPGAALPEMVDGVHRGVSGSEPLELLVFYAGAKGVPLTQPVMEPAPSKND
ncbi:Cupin domain protein [Chitinasiproducens palmae]|uniref:Cupin domain protein n=2 Tax=Chitinasiproducens palmae TaxID=1770053 RepID=A0A1H2PJ35_9BURK|nr:Cupin domain protein [Chitinasiproducens palmae]